MKREKASFVLIVVYVLMMQTAEAVCVRWHVVDEEDHPVANAEVWFGWRTSSFVTPEGETVLTDTNGCYKASHFGGAILEYAGNKKGYYGSSGQVALFGIRPNPFNIFGVDKEIKLTLKKIGLYAGTLKVLSKKLRYAKTPAFDKWLGIDLEVGDWVAPYGTGKETDLLLRHHVEKRSNTNFHYELDLSFTNMPYAGAYRMKGDTWSWLNTAHTADSNAVFASTVKFVRISRDDKGPTVYDILKGGDYLVYRTRTRVDEHGNLVSAHYGIINGQLSFADDGFEIPDGCFNPTPNDTNIEDGSGLRNYLR